MKKTRDIVFDTMLRASGYFKSTVDSVVTLKRNVEILIRIVGNMSSNQTAMADTLNKLANMTLEHDEALVEIYELLTSNAVPPLSASKEDTPAKRYAVGQFPLLHKKDTDDKPN